MEMALAHRAAFASKDSTLVMKGAQNITLAEAITKLMQLRGAANPKANGGWSGPLQAAPPVVRMLPFSHPTVNPERRVVRSATSSEYFVRQVDSSPNQVTKSTVECMMFLPAPSGLTIGTVWCGLGSGFIQVMLTSVAQRVVEPFSDYV